MLPAEPSDEAVRSFWLELGSPPWLLLWLPLCWLLGEPGIDGPPLLAEDGLGDDAPAGGEELDEGLELLLELELLDDEELELLDDELLELLWDDEELLLEEELDELLGGVGMLGDGG